MDTVGVVTRGRVQRAKDEVTFKSEHLALSNKLVLSEIFQYGSHSDLKSFRQVSRTWFKESHAIFNNKSKVRLVQEEMERGWGRGMRLENYLDHYSDYNHHNYQLGTTSEYYNNGRTHRLEKFDYMDRMTSFLGHVGSGVKSLDLRWNAADHWDLYFINRSLALVPNLVELNLRVQRRLFDETNVPPYPSGNIFPSVTKLGIGYDAGICGVIESASDRERLRESCFRLINMTPNIVELDIGSHCHLETFGLTYFQIFLTMQSLSPETIILPKLDSIRLKYHTHSPSILLDMFILMCDSNPLRQISLACVGLQESSTTQQLQTILEKNANTLEKIELQVGVQDRGIKMPDCRKLRKLELIGFEPLNRLFGSAPAGGLTDTLQLKQVFELGPTAFKRKFPCLTSLKIRTAVKSFGPSELGAFFPQDDDLVFPQFLQVDVFGPGTKETGKEYEDWTIRLAKMFPNVHNPQLTKARSKIKEVDRSVNQ